MRTSSAVKPDSSITADNHFQAARNPLKLRDSIGPPYRASFQVMCQESLHAVLTKNVFGLVAGLSRSPSASVRRSRERERTIERLRQARALVGSTDALERFDAWRALEER